MSSREVTITSRMLGVSVRPALTLTLARLLLSISMFALLLQATAAGTESGAPTAMTSEPGFTSTPLPGALAPQLKTDHHSETASFYPHNKHGEPGNGPLDPPTLIAPISPTDLPMCSDDTDLNKPTTGPIPTITDSDSDHVALAPRQGLYGNHHNAPDPNHNPPSDPAHTGNHPPTSPDDNTNPDNTDPDHPDNTTGDGPSLPSDTSLPFPQNMYDSPAHAVAAGLLVGTVATIGVWFAGCFARAYAGWIGREVRATGWGRGVLYW